jgi:monothiol glutaredoxin
MRCLSTEVKRTIEAVLSTAPVVLFMKGTPDMPQCGFSKATVQILGLQGVDPEKFTAFNVLEDEEVRQGMWLSCACRRLRLVGGIWVSGNGVQARSRC